MFERGLVTWRNGLQAFGLALVINAVPERAEALEERLTVSGTTLSVHNLVGEVVVEGHSGTGFDIVATILGGDAEPGLISLEEIQGENGPHVRVAFPLDESTRYVYPELNRGANIQLRMDPPKESDSVVGNVLRRLRSPQVRVRGSGSGLELWADVTIRVPEGGTLEVWNGVGDVLGHDIPGNVSIDSHLGLVSVDGVKGNLGVDVGNGEVEVTGVTGDVNLDSGNGKMTLADSNAGNVSIDSGNGRIRVRDVTCKEIEVDTGNGPVEIEGLSAERGGIDTGNGTVDVVFAHLGAGEFVIDTGNGSISVELPADASARVFADTSRGGIRLDVDESTVDIVREKRDEVEAVFGDGLAELRLDSGNGRIEILQ